MTDLAEKAVITIFGAGLVGCYVGGMLASRGNNVLFFGREKTGNSVTQYGMALSSHHKPIRTIAGDHLKWISSEAALAGSDLVLVCVKSADTAKAAAIIDEYCKAGTTIISFQNGIGNGDTLRQTIKDNTVLAAMVGFNVVRFDEQPLRYHCASEGEIIIEDHAHSQYLVQKLRDADITSRTDSNIQSILWGKLLLNLNNGVNVLSDLPLKQQLENRYYRKILALSIEEALGVIRFCGIKPAKIGKVKPEFTPALLRLPNFIFKILAGSMLKIDENARSSMWEDFVAGRRSEIDYLNGAVCSLGADHGRPTPVNDKIVELVSLKFDGREPDFASARDMYDAVIQAKNRHHTNETG